MIVTRKTADLRKKLLSFRKKGRIIALVPTMGALHEGHISLVRQAKEMADIVVVTIFVNHKQFGKNEDFSKYPRTEKKDLALLKKAKADFIFIPNANEIYPEGFSGKIEVGEIGNILEGSFRPGFFSGVATVVAKFFNIVQPDMAIFGEKDFQQLAVIRKLVEDLNFTIEILGGATIRENNGLAFSSRNIYLSQAERKIAPLFYAALVSAKKKIAIGSKIHDVISRAKEELLCVGFSKIDYIEYVDSETFLPLTKFSKNGRLLAAVWLGKTRLIDNV